MRRLIVTIMLLCCAAPFAQAADQAKLGAPYVLGKLGMYDIDLNKADPVYSLGLMVGTEVYPDLTVEADFDYGLDGGKYKLADGSKGQYELWTLAAYLAYRLPLFHGFYLKLKGGYLYESVNHKKPTGNVDRTDDDFSVGGGLGFVVNDLFGKRVTFELQYTQVEQKIAATQLGIHVPF